MTKTYSREETQLRASSPYLLTRREVNGTKGQAGSTDSKSEHRPQGEQTKS